MITEPIVSVVIPAFNAAKTVGTAIESVLRQSLSNLEVIVINDGSSDETVAQIKKVTDSRVSLISQDNLGQSAAINNGVSHARGAYIKLLDADDWLNTKHLESQLHAIGGQPNILASCRWGYFVEHYENPTLHAESTNQDYDKPLEWIVDSLTRDEGMMGGWMWLIPMSLWNEAGGFDTRLSLNNDFHFSIKLLLASNGVRFADDAIYSYRKGVPSALSGSSGRNAMESAYLTTELGVHLLLMRENSPRIRKICADRFQQWLFRFYPEYPDLTVKTERWIDQLDGSDVELQGGAVTHLLRPVLGWKRIRRMQVIAYGLGWKKVLRFKHLLRKRSLERLSGTQR